MRAHMNFASTAVLDIADLLSHLLFWCKIFALSASLVSVHNDLRIYVCFPHSSVFILQLESFDRNKSNIRQCVLRALVNSHFIAPMGLLRSWLRQRNFDPCRFRSRWVISRAPCVNGSLLAQRSVRKISFLTRIYPFISILTIL